MQQWIDNSIISDSRWESPTDKPVWTNYSTHQKTFYWSHVQCSICNYRKSHIKWASKLYRLKHVSQKTVRGHNIPTPPSHPAPTPHPSLPPCPHPPPLSRVDRVNEIYRIYILWWTFTFNFHKMRRGLLQYYASTSYWVVANISSFFVPLLARTNGVFKCICKRQWKNGPTVPHLQPQP